MKSSSHMCQRWLSWVLFAVFALYLVEPTLAQEDNQTGLPDIIEQILEENEETDFDFGTYLEDIQFYLENPIDLNKSTFEELSELRILSPEQIAALLTHIAQNKELISIYEVQAIPFWDLETIEDVLPFVKVKSDLEDYNVPFLKLLYQGKFQLFFRYQQTLQKKAGYEEPDPESTSQYYKGSPFKLYTRFRYNYGNRVSYGLTMEKDDGEEFFRGSQKRGFDFYSAHFFIRDFGKLKALALGDYEVKFGQGLTMWSGFGFRKSPSVMNIKKEGTKLKPYTSVNEALFLRGAAITLGEKAVEFTAFGSYKSIDANVSQIDTTFNEIVEVSSFQESGFHRTQNEIDDRHSVKQTVAGANLSYNKRTWHVGMNAVHTRVNVPLTKALRPYNQFDFSSDKLTNFSLDYNYILRNFHFFGEGAMSDNGGFGAVNGILMSLDPRVNLSVLYRYYSKDYQSLFSNAFAESSRPQNERGIYFGLSTTPIRRVAVDVYVDLYKFPWLKFQADAPSSGQEFFAQVIYRPSRRLKMTGRWKHEVKRSNTPDNVGRIDYLSDIRRTSYRYEINFKISDAVSLKSRVEMSMYDTDAQAKEKGYLIFQDINFKPLSFPLSFSTRFALFDTESFQTRLYAYENDVLYSFSVPAYQNRGSRYYFVMKYHLARGVDIWLRFAQSFINNKKTIGSGLDEIDGNVRSDVKAQIRFKF